MRSFEKMLEKKYKCPSRENKAVQVSLPIEQGSLMRSNLQSQDYSDEQTLGAALNSRNHYQRTQKYRDTSHSLL